MMRKKKTDEEMKKKVEEKERKRKQRERVRENRKWAESQDLTPYLKRLQAEKEGVSVHESEEDRNSEEVNTESVIERGESITNEVRSSHPTIALPETGMSTKNSEDNRVEQSVETVKSTMSKDVEPEVESVLKVGEGTKEVAEKHVAEVASQNNVENNDTTRQERVELTTNEQSVETHDRGEKNTTDKQLDKGLDNEKSGDNVTKDPTAARSSNNVETITEGQKEVESVGVEEKLEGWTVKLKDLLNAQTVIEHHLKFCRKLHQPEYISTRTQNIRPLRGIQKQQQT
eukprot:Em0074g1a